MLFAPPKIPIWRRRQVIRALFIKPPLQFSLLFNSASFSSKEASSLFCRLRLSWNSVKVQLPIIQGVPKKRTFRTEAASSAALTPVREAAHLLGDWWAASLTGTRAALEAVSVLKVRFFGTPCTLIITSDIKAWSKAADPSGRAVAGVHVEAYKEKWPRDLK